MHFSFLTSEYPHPRVNRAAGIGASIRNLADGLVPHNKPCDFLNYHYQDNGLTYQEDAHFCIFIHFRSMPSPKDVALLSNPNKIGVELEGLFKNSKPTVECAKEWNKVICLHPAESASNRISNFILNNISKL